MTARIAILISGRGSNMAALIRACEDEHFPAEVALVVSDRPDAGGLNIAHRFNIPTQIVDSTGSKSKEAFESALDDKLKKAEIDLICLAGFMRLLSGQFTEEWRDLLVNIHPSLLPAFRGMNTHERALEVGVKLHGCTVHYVREEMDDGPIIGQAAVPVLPGDTPDTLAERVLAAEHLLYPACVRMVVEGRAPVRRDHVMLDAPDLQGSPLFMPPAAPTGISAD